MVLENPDLLEPLGCEIPSSLLKIEHVTSEKREGQQMILHVLG